MAASAAALALLAGCAAGSGGSGDSPEPSAAGGHGDSLTLGATIQPYGWDPSNQPGYQNWVAEAVWDKLVYCNEVGAPVKGIAESWEISKDNRSFTAHLREGQKFTDGTPVDAKAVAANFDYISKNGSNTANYKGITLDTPDARTFTVTWPQPQPLISNLTCSPFISSPAVLKSKKFDAPLGSGPYILDKDGTTTGQVYAFTKNPDYWNADAYAYDKLKVKVIQSETAGISALKTGQIDGVPSTASTYDEVDNAKGLAITTIKGSATMRLILTDRAGKKIPALGDVRVRRAMNMVMDKQAVVDKLYGGHAQPSYQIFRPGSGGYLEHLKDPYPYDVEKAQGLMKDAGFADGFTLNLPTVEGIPMQAEILPYVTQQLAKLNIKVTQTPLSGANTYNDLLSGTYPVVLWPLGNSGDAVQDIKNGLLTDGFWNVSHQSDATIDAAWKRIVNRDEQERKAAEQEIAKYVVDQAWNVIIANPDFFYAHSDSVTIDHVSDPEGLTPKLIDFK
ncbi:ABC transporter substrate-binding protein [Pengzhenrongella sp.]|jgi:peptide/nickel transport system substrate-binding protein|uniref:ABC transporter substrate-binding protein n=1 Tax=Pengzhenrongella sp. TaxID=2888820 RepID=UPI002F92705C